MTIEALAGSATLNLVQGQLAPNGIRNETVLEAFLSLDRTSYLPHSLKAFANIDDNVGDKDGHVLLMRPVALALMVQYLADTVSKGGNVAIIGDDSGYIRDVLAFVGFVGFVIHDEQSLKQGAPWDAIIINGCVMTTPHYLFDYTQVEGIVLTIIRPEQSGIGDIVAMSQTQNVILGQGSAPYNKALLPEITFSL